MPENNEMILDLISQNIRIQRPGLPDDQYKNLAAKIRDIFETLNGGIMQLEDATENVISYCLNLVTKTDMLNKSSNKLISSYDLITDKISNIVVKIKETNNVFKQNVDVQNIVNKNINNLFNLPSKLIKNMQNIFERSNTLILSAFTQTISKTVDKIINLFKSISNFIRDPLKTTRESIINNVFERPRDEDRFFKSERRDTNDRKTLFGFRDLNIAKTREDAIINKKTLAGIMQLEDATENIISYCLNLLAKTDILNKSSNKLVSSYDLITEKINNITTKIKETNIAFKQNADVQNIVNKNLNYLFNLPNKLIKNMQSVFERSNTLIMSAFTQTISKTVDKIISSFKAITNFIRDPLKTARESIINYVFERPRDEDRFFKNKEVVEKPKIENQFFKSERRDTNDRKSLFGFRDLNIAKTREDAIINKKINNVFERPRDEDRFFKSERRDTNDRKTLFGFRDLNIAKTREDAIINKKTLAGITDITLDEQTVLKKSAPGVAITWLAKQLRKTGLVPSESESRGGIISRTKDYLLQGLGIAGGAALIPKLKAIIPLLLNPWVLGTIAVALGGALIWKFRKPISEFLDNVAASAEEWVGMVKDKFLVKFDEIKDIFANSLKKSLEKIQAGWDLVAGKFDNIKNAWRSSIDSVNEFLGNIGEKASDIYNSNILPLLKEFDNMTGRIFSTAINNIKKLGPYLEKMDNWIISFGEKIENFITSSGRKVLDWFKDLKDKVIPEDIKAPGIMGATRIGEDIKKIDEESKHNREQLLAQEKTAELVTKVAPSLYDIRDIKLYDQRANRMMTEDDLIKTAYNLIKKYESGGAYGAVNRNDAGAVSLGILQWHAERAQNYLKRLYDIDPEKFSSVMGDKIVKDLRKGNWSKRTFSVEESRNFAKLMEDSRMRAETDRLAMEDIAKYFKQAKLLGVQDYRSLPLAASMINQYGFTGFKNLLENRLGTTDFDTLVEIFEKDKNFPYRTRRLREIEDLGDLYENIKIIKDNLPKNIDIPAAAESYKRSTDIAITNEIKSSLKGVSESFKKSVDELKAEVKEVKTKTDNRGMVDSPISQINGDNMYNIPKYIMEMIFGLNIGGEDKKFGGIF